MSEVRGARRGRLVWAAVVAAAGVLAGVEAPAFAVEGSWRETGSLNVPRQQATATLLDNGNVLVAGGRNFVPNDALQSAELYDPVTETFALTGSMSTGRWAHTATLLPNGKVLVAGGFTDPTTSANAQPVTDTAELYDPATGTWSPTGSMNVRRALHVAQLMDDGRVLVAGGRTCNAPPPTACNFQFTTNTAEIYDPATGAWTSTTPMSNDRHTTSAVLLPTGEVLVPAGFPGGQNTAEVYDPDTQTWTPTGPLSIGRARQGAMLLPDGDVLVAAGAVGGTPPRSSETYDRATNTWAPAGNVNQTRFNYFFTELPNGKVLIAGGAPGTAGGPAETTAEIFDPASRTWSSAGTLPNPHGSSSSLGNSTRMVVLSGDAGECGQNCGKVLLVGDNPQGAAELYTPAFLCTTTVTGEVGNVTVPTGSVTCVNDAFVAGSITVQPGGSLVLTNSRVTGGVLSQGSTGVRICGSQITSDAGSRGNGLVVTGTNGPVIVGDGTPSCPRNDISGGVYLEGNDSVELDTNRVNGTVALIGNSGPVVAANQVTGNLDCTDNDPPPTDEGRPNTVLGARTGQCASL
ncbi:MAG TPA: kelch repeat-containing protein [Acidimicrobiales bacterium]|nr:kelch repeat-containing protein [Acidimicrobiales bacterium]